jgi:hypothetical protein
MKEKNNAEFHSMVVRMAATQSRLSVPLRRLLPVRGMRRVAAIHARHSEVARVLRVSHRDAICEGDRGRGRLSLKR